MTRLPERVFWSLVLLLQLGATGVELTLSPLRFSLLAAVSALCCVSMIGLVLQRRIYRHNFWAGVVGVVFPYGALLALALVATAGVAVLVPVSVFGNVAPFVVAAMLVQLLTFAAPFIYVFGSPQIWLGPNNSSKPKPLRGSA